MDTLAYLIYGSGRDYHLELTYSVLSAVHRAKAENFDLRIVLITDESTRRPDLPVEHVVFSRAEFLSWTMDGQYKHQAKLHALLKVLDLFAGKVALVDTDTYFNCSPQRLFERIAAGSSLMHAYERLLGADSYLRPILDRLDGEPLAYTISPDTRLFNSGVIGLHHHDRSLVPDALGLLAQLYRIYPAFNTEQFALSIVLGQKSSLKECPDLIRHYYGYERPFIHIQIAELFPKFSSEQFQQHLRDLPPVGGFPKKRRIDQLKARLKAATRREGEEYRFAYLALLSALANARRSPRDANIWAQIALDVIRKHEFVIQYVERDFQPMRRLDVSAWPDDVTRKTWSSFWQELAHNREHGRVRTISSSSVPAA